MNNVTRLLLDLLDYDGESGNRALEDWEIQFIESLNLRLQHHQAYLTPAQRAKLSEIWEAVFR